MKTLAIKAYVMLAVTLGMCTAAFGQIPGVVTVSTNYNVNQAIPDNDVSGIQITRTFNFMSPVMASNIADLNVSLNISGDFNGDLYAYVTHGASGFAVLLNRVGRTAANSDGYSDDGFNIKLDDGATGNGDVHVYRVKLGGPLPAGTQLTGSWQPDARNVLPQNVLDSDARTATLASFNGLDPNGSWTLFVADLSPGGSSTVVSWGLEVTVPEPGTVGLMIAGGLTMLYFARRRLSKSA